jgi:hypothetical protein
MVNENIVIVIRFYYLLHVNKGKKFKKQEVIKKLQHATRSIVNECNVIIPKDKKWECMNLNRSIPSIRYLIKFHTVDAPIRPIEDWTKAPAYKLAKVLLKQLLPQTLPPTISVQFSKPTKLYKRTSLTIRH